MIGERIQYYRKKKGLSQEELGARLHLSRQTVSLWEKGQTLPTIDNLLRLREIFDTTLDELVEEQTETNFEKYELTLSSEALEGVKRQRVMRLYKATLPSFFVWVLMTAVFLLLDASPLIVGFVLGALFVDLSLGLTRLFADRRELSGGLDRMLETTFIYTVTSDELRVEVMRDGNTVKCVSCPFPSLEVGETVGDITFFKVCGEELFMNKRLLDENSILKSYI